MRNAHKRWGLGAALILTAGSLLAMAAPPAANASQQPKACSMQPRAGHIAGIVPAIGTCTSGVAAPAAAPFAAPFTSRITASNHANGTPPLLWHGGPVMMTPSSTPLTVTPIYWDPADHPMTSTYKSIISAYLGAVATDSGHNDNVFSVANEYFGSNGQIHYHIRLGFPINDTNPLPADGCTVASKDRTAIYADNSGYDACLDDAQLQAEIDRVTSSPPMPHNLTQIYVLFLPKHVESCVNPGSSVSTAGGQACTINYEPTAAYCAYHSQSTSNAVYANMPFPIYKSKVGFTCGTEKNFGVIESPNGNPDADVEVSPTSHEINESITDPDTSTGWYDTSGFENGDECAYVFGQTQGAPGALFNQVIRGFRFLTQEEFSNRDFAITGGGCVQSAADEAP